MAGLGAVLRRHDCIGIDTAIFIYHLEAAPRYAQLTRTVFDELANGTFQGLTSILTLMELVARPLQLDRPDIADEYEVLVANYPNLTIAELNRSTVRQAAELRAAYRLTPPDALQVATSLQQGASAMLTNDRGIRRVREIEVLILDDFAEEPARAD